MIRYFFLPLLFCVPHLSAQEFLQIQGVVLDQKTQEPLPFVHVGIPEKGIGTVTNQQGHFTFYFPVGHLNETLVVSHIGYFDLRRQLSPTDLKEPVRLAMRPNAVHLDEVEVLSTEYPLTHFIKKAIKNISNNYPRRLHFMSGFYREAKINGETRKYDRLLEAAVDIQDKGMKSSPDNVRIQVNELRKSDDFSDYSQIDRELTAQYGDHSQMYDLQLPYNHDFWKNYNVLTLEPLNPEVKLDLEWRTSLEEQFIKNGAQY